MAIQKHSAIKCTRGLERRISGFERRQLSRLRRLCLWRLGGKNHPPLNIKLHLLEKHAVGLKIARLLDREFVGIRQVLHLTTLIIQDHPALNLTGGFEWDVRIKLALQHKVLRRAALRFCIKPRLLQ